MTRVKENQVSFGMALLGITCTTIGHYLGEFWFVGYVVALGFSIIAGPVYMGE